MIYIISQSDNEHATELVMDWILYSGGSCLRLNGLDLLNIENEFTINVSQEHDINLRSDLDEPRIVWFRRWNNIKNLNAEYGDSTLFNSESLLDLAKSEFSGLSAAFCASLPKLKWAEPPALLRKEPGKLEQLQRAKEIGLYIPATIITNNKKSLQQFIKALNNKKVIIKPIKEFQVITVHNGTPFATYTKVINDSLGDVEDSFFPALFQEAIHKEFEARIFYLDGTCYSMGIFSNKDKQTQEDFRRYNHSVPNRFIPIEIPLDLSNKIKLLMDSYQLKTGSLDFIVDEHFRFVFLEVNPLGQFGMVSMPCNYFLEQKVANWLMQLSN